MVESFFERQKAIAAQKRAANRIIQDKARAAALKEREAQEIRVAKEKERISADRRIKTAKEGGVFTQFARSTQRAAPRARAVGRKVSVARAITPPKRKKKARRVMTVRKTTRRRKSPKQRDPFDFDMGF